MLTVTTKTGKVQKQVFVVARYEITKGEQAGRIIHVVRSVKTVKKQLVQNDYQVITFNDQDGRVTCGCEATGDCCHMLESASYDMRRCNSIAPAHKSIVTPVAQPAREMKVFTNGEHYEPRYFDGKRWQSFKDENGMVVCFVTCTMEDLAHKYIKVDADEHRATVWNEYQQRLAEAIAENERAWEAHKAQASAQPAVKTTVLNGNRGFQLCKSWAEIEAERAAKKAVA